MWRISLLLLAAGGLSAQEVPPERWVPDPTRWHLVLTPDPGGWWISAPEELQVRVTDPTDPRPVRGPGEDPWDFWEAERERRNSAFRRLSLELLKRDPEGGPQAEALMAQSWAPDREVAVGEAYGAWAMVLRAQRKARTELEAIRQTRTVTVQAWLNGQRMDLTAELNHSRTLPLPGLKGENRLELIEPRSGQRLVRTWWQGSSAPRLQVHLEGEGPDWYDLGQLRLLEPNGKLSRPGASLSRRTPARGTYTLTWSKPHYRAWWRDEEPDLGNAPIRLRAQVILDAGTDRERRWTFESLGLPGAIPQTLGSFDVEDD